MFNSEVESIFKDKAAKEDYYKKVKGKIKSSFRIKKEKKNFDMKKFLFANF